MILKQSTPPKPGKETGGFGVEPPRPVNFTKLSTGALYPFG